MSHVLTRRIPVAEPMSSPHEPRLATADDADAALLALRPKWRIAWQAYMDTFDPLAEAEKRFRTREYRLPERERFVGTDAQHAMAVAVAMQKNERLEIEVGLADARHKQGDAATAEWDLGDEALTIAARTVEGIRFKLELLKEREGYENDEAEALLKSDLLHMVGIHDVAGAPAPSTVVASAMLTTVSPNDVELIALGVRLEALHAERLAFDVANPTADDDPFYEPHWQLRAAINRIPAATHPGLVVKAKAAQMALRQDPANECECDGAFRDLSSSLIDDLLRMSARESVNA